MVSTHSACTSASRSDSSCITLLAQWQFLYTSGPQSSCAVHCCSSTQLTCGSQLWPPTTHSSARTKTPIQEGNTFTASQIPEPLNVISRLHPKKLVKAMELQGSSCRAIFNFTSESSVLKMRTMRTSAFVTTLELLRASLGQCVTRNFSNHSRPRASTR